MIISFSVVNQKLTLNGSPYIVGESLNYLEAEFAFTEDWDGLVKYAHFIKGEANYETQLVSGRIPQSAGLNLEAGTWIVSVHGVDIDGEDVVQRITTNTVPLVVVATSFDDGEPFPEIGGSIGEQILLSEAARVIAETLREAKQINRNWIFEGRDLSTIYTAAELAAKIAAGDFDNIRVGDYWPMTLSGTYRDFGTYTCPAGTTYFSDTGLTTSAGTTAQTYEATYVNETYCSIIISSTTYYVAAGDCLAYYARTLSNAIFKEEVTAIDNYINYGDSALTSHHITFVSRDLIPQTIKMRKGGSNWTNLSETSPWNGSALYKTLNDPENGIIALVKATDIGAYIYDGPNDNGMRYLSEIKAPGIATATGVEWRDRGKLFLPYEREIWGADIYSEHQYGSGLSVQWPLFRDSLRHVVKGLGDGGSRTPWWCQTSRTGSSVSFTYVYFGFPDFTSSINTAISTPLCFLIS